jgi:hypothetical protein
MLALADIVRAAESGARVRRVTESGDVVEGVARHLVTSPDSLIFPGDGDDVRDCYLRVTAMFEWFWPVAELIDQRVGGEFGID